MKKSHSIIILAFLFLACKKADKLIIVVPTLSNTTVYNITKATASSNYHVDSNGGDLLTESGVCWSTNPNPTINDSKVKSDIIGQGSNSVSIGGLALDKKYYLRAYAINSAGAGYSNQVVFNTPTFYLGQNYGGGFIFFIDPSGLHGLISAPSDFPHGTNRINWSIGNNQITNATSLTDGLTNTNLIILAHGNTGVYPAKLCKDYRGGGFSDWFLPSTKQLQSLYVGRSENFLETGIVDDFYASFVNDEYWSSSEASKDGALVVNLGSGLTNIRSKSNMDGLPNVRAIRNF